MSILRVCFLYLCYTMIFVNMNSFQFYEPPARASLHPDRRPKSSNLHLPSPCGEGNNRVSRASRRTRELQVRPVNLPLLSGMIQFRPHVREAMVSSSPLPSAILQGHPAKLASLAIRQQGRPHMGMLTRWTAAMTPLPQTTLVAALGTK